MFCKLTLVPFWRGKKYAKTYDFQTALLKTTFQTSPPSSAPPHFYRKGFAPNILTCHHNKLDRILHKQSSTQSHDSIGKRWQTTSPPFLVRSRIRQVWMNYFCLELATNIVYRSIVRSTTKSAPAAMATAARENTSSRRTRKPFSCPTSTRTQPMTPRTR